MLTRRIVWIDSNGFCGFACAACSWKFAVPGERNSDCLPVELARSGFDHHNCTDYCITTATLISALVSALEAAIGILAKEVQRCKGDEQRTVLLQARAVLHSAAANCHEIRTSLSRLLEGVRPN
jgi:hypothetical protein